MNELDVKVSFYFRMYEDKVEGILDHLRNLPGVRDLKVLRCVKIKDSKSKEDLLKKVEIIKKGGG